MSSNNNNVKSVENDFVLITDEIKNLKSLTLPTDIINNLVDLSSRVDIIENNYCPKNIQTIQNIINSESNVTLTDFNSLYKITPSSDISITFDNNTSSNNKIAYTFELCIVISGNYSIMFPPAVIWQNNETPDITTVGTYFFAFRTIDGGVTWFGNLQGRW